MPAGARRRVRQPRQHQVADVLRHVVVAPGDEDLLPGHRVACRRPSARPACAPRRRPSPPAARSGSSCRSTSPATSCGRIDRLERAPAHGAPAPRSGPGLSSGQSDSARLAAGHHLVRRRSAASPAAPCRRAPDRPRCRPSRPRRARGRPRRSPGVVRTTPFSSRAGVRSPARRSGASTSSASRAASASIASTVSGVASAKRAVSASRPAPSTCVEQEAHLGHRRAIGHRRSPAICALPAPRADAAITGRAAAGPDSRPPRRRRQAGRRVTDARAAPPSRSPDSDRGVRAAAALLRAGELVAFPTETVYGLGADARSDRAVAAIFAAKGRPAFNPLIVHVAGLAGAGAPRAVHPRGPRARRRASGPAR